MGTIRIQSVSKAYRQYPSRWSRLLEWTLPFLGLRHTKKSVLRNINIDVAQGEAVGVIGINGAGKSTLLKIITGTILPTTGSITVTGRVGTRLRSARSGGGVEVDVDCHGGLLSTDRSPAGTSSVRLSVETGNDSPLGVHGLKRGVSPRIFPSP